MEQTELQAFWEQVLTRIRETLAEPACKKWLVPLKPLDLTSTALTLGAKTDFERDWIEGRVGLSCRLYRNRKPRRKTRHRNPNCGKKNRNMSNRSREHSLTRQTPQPSATQKICTS